jgi:branched-chain amino acid transport system permease protein
MYRVKFSRILLLLTLLVVVFLIPMAGNDYYIYLGILMFINAVLGMSLRQVLMVGQLSLGHGAFMAIGAYTSALFSKSFGISFWLALPTAGLMTSVIAVGLGYLTLRIRGAYFAIATFALGEIVRLVLVAFEKPFGGPAGIKGIPAPSLALPGLVRPCLHCYRRRR